MKIPTAPLACLLLLLQLPVLKAQTEIGYIEKFALSPDRSKVLGDLVPGSHDYRKIGTEQ